MDFDTAWNICYGPNAQPSLAEVLELEGADTSEVSFENGNPLKTILEATRM